MSSHETLGLILVREGLITRPQLYDALRLQRQNNRLLGTCLLSLGYLEPQALLSILSRQLAIPALPPGALNRASPEAVKRVPGELAARLRVVPYSWDGQMLGVAVADGRVLSQLHEVALHAKAAIGAYVALEMEIEGVLRRIYPGVHVAAPTSPVAATAAEDRPRPARATPLNELPTRNFGAALGLEEHQHPVVLNQPKPAPAQGGAAPPPAPAASGSAPPPAASKPARETPRGFELGKPPSFPPCERVGLYDAVEKIYESQTAKEMGRWIAAALLNYFSRVLVFFVEHDALHVLAYAGVTPSRCQMATQALQQTASRLGQQGVAYGKAGSDPRTSELAKAFGLGQARTGLITTLGVRQSVPLVITADNAEIEDLYDDLHDVEMLFKEAETALGILAPGS